jgi:hypothetical protein
VADRGEHVKSWLKSLLSGIKSGALLPGSYYLNLDYNAAVDALNQNGEFDLS